jgi:hypothetical protein
MQKKLLFLLTVFLFLSLQITWGQTEYLSYSSWAINGSGARAAGMGYAFTGIADDATAISWNAAGLTQLQSPEASIIARMGFGSVSEDIPAFNVDLLAGLPLTIDPEAEISTKSKFQLNFASIVFPFSVSEKNVVGGIAFRRFFDFSNKWTITSSASVNTNQYYAPLGQTVNINGDFETEDEIELSGGINAITPAIGFQFSEIFSVGVAFNILTGSQEETYSYKENSQLSMAIGGVPYYSSSSDTSYSETYEPTDYSGTAFELGVLVKPSPQFNLGASISLPSKLTEEYSEDEYDRTIKYKMPLFFSLGAAYRATDNLTLAFDYRSRAWSKMKYDSYEVNGNEYDQLWQWNESLQEYEQVDLEDYEIYEYDANSIHIGMEYLAQSGENVLPLRIGFYTLPTLGEDRNGDQIKFNAFTAGAGLVMESIILDASVEFITGSIEVEEYESFSGTYIDTDISIKDFRFTLGAAIHFGQK